MNRWSNLRRQARRLVANAPVSMLIRFGLRSGTLIVSLSMRDHARFRGRKTGKPFDFIHLTVSLGIRCGGIWRVNEDVGEAGNIVLRLISRET
jgi:hypothetical protein